MPQIQLPFFPPNATGIGPELACVKEDDRVVYFNGTMPVFSHAEDDIRSFRMITAMFCEHGTVKQVDIVRAFKVPPLSVKRAVKTYREAGIAGFFGERKGRGAAVLTAAVLTKAQALFDQGLGISAVAKALGLLENTVRKAVLAGRLHRVAVGRSMVPVSTRSERSVRDAAAAMGMGATDAAGRVAASLGQFGPVQPMFQAHLDVPGAGVMLALPALLACGLVKDIDEHFSLPKGYYGMASLFVMLAFISLARLRSLEALQGYSPGEWGKLLGLDRVPEVRTLRVKIKLLTQGEQAVHAWSGALCRTWLAEAGEPSQVLYVDGHVRVYHGENTKLPKHYVARQRLCLRASVDYWVNAADSQPYFKINQPVDPGLQKTLEDEIVPRLEKDIPNQPDEACLTADILRHRFTIVFDREGYGPALFAAMKKKRIACLTYNKRPGEDWDAEEFLPIAVTAQGGNSIEMNLAERGTRLSNGLWLREIRRLTESGHQTAVLSTDYRSPTGRLAGAMFSRWSQENFFRYMRQHFGLDALIDYGVEKIPETIPVINPTYRTISQTITIKTGLLRRRQALLGKMMTTAAAAAAAGDTAITELKEKLQAEILGMHAECDRLKAERKTIQRRITAAELPEEHAVMQLRQSTKHFVDTLKMVAYRAETAMVSILRDVIAKKDEARTLAQFLYQMAGDVIPDPASNTLTVRLHHAANQRTDQALIHLCRELNETKTIFPQTDLTLVYEMVSSQNHRDPEV